MELLCARVCEYSNDLNQPVFVKFSPNAMALDDMPSSYFLIPYHKKCQLSRCANT